MADLALRVKLDYIPKNLLTAFKLANTAPYENYKLGAVISVKQKSKPFSKGVNIDRTSPLQDKFSCAVRDFKPKSTHAEIAAISNARVNSLIGSSIFVARITKRGNWANSKPCSGCQKAIKYYGIKTMYYWEEGNFYKEDL